MFTCRHLGILSSGTFPKNLWKAKLHPTKGNLSSGSNHEHEVSLITDLRLNICRGKEEEQYINVMCSDLVEIIQQKGEKETREEKLIDCHIIGGS